jgi:hypothetical protein
MSPKFGLLVAVPVAVGLLAASTPANAYWRGGYGYRGYGVGPVVGAIVGLGVGAAIAGAYAPRYYAPPVYYAPPPPVYYAPPPVYYAYPGYYR